MRRLPRFAQTCRIGAPAGCGPQGAVRAQPMRLWWRRIVVAVSALLLLLVGVATWLVLSFDSARFKSAAIEWMQAHHARELAFDGPVTLQLWPQPAVTVRAVRLSEQGQPRQRFAAIEAAALTLRLEPLLARREFEIDSVSAKGVKLNFRRDADGRRNIDDLLAHEVGAAPPGAGKPVLFESLELAEAEVQVADALGGVEGLVRVQQLRLGRFGPSLRSPLHLQAQAELKQPAVNAALVLDAGFELLPAPAPGGPPIVSLDKARLALRGQGFRIEGLVAQLQAESIRLDYAMAPSVEDSHVDLADVQLQFSGTRLGWQVDTGRLGLARLRLELLSRTLELEQLALQLQGRRHATTLDAQFAWPALKVVGESLRGGPMDGHLTLGGDQRLQLKLSSQAPSGAFERITLPALQVDVDGQIGPSTVQGHAQATLVLEPKPFAAALDGLALALRFSDPALPPMQLALQGRAQLSARAGEAVVKGTINDQRVEARVQATLDRPRRFIDVDASFGTLDLKRFVTPDERGAAPAPAAASRSRCGRRRCVASTWRRRWLPGARRPRPAVTPWPPTPAARPNSASSTRVSMFATAWRAAPPTSTGAATSCAWPAKARSTSPRAAWITRCAPASSTPPAAAPARKWCSSTA